MKISFVIPAFNEEENIVPFFNLLSDTMKKSQYEYEAIFVDDGSSDNTFSQIKSIFDTNTVIKAISFSRNFGKDAAVLAGIEISSGDYTAVIDCDLQQLPETVLQMAKILDEDKSISRVSAYQKKRNESFIVAFLKKRFYKVINLFSRVKFAENASDFGIFRNDVKNAFLSLNDKVRLTKFLFTFAGFKTEYFPYVPEKRYKGKTKWNLFSLISYAFSGLVSFSEKLYILPLSIGFILLVSSLIFLAVSLISGMELFKIATLFLILLISGLIFEFIGVIIAYLNQILNESKQRPKYIVKEKLEK